MALFLITGLPGTGKSTVCTALKTRGLTAYDGDYDHLARWYNNTTGQPVLGSHERTVEFLENHSRDIKPGVVKSLVKDNTPVFLCADPENEDELAPLFDKIFALILDEKTRQNRLAARTNNTWGKTPHEIAYDLAIKPKAYARYEKLAYIKIDASNAPADIATLIEKSIK